MPSWLPEEVDEGIQGVLVHVVDDVQLDDKEIEHSSLGCDHSVEFPLRVDFHFCLLRLLSLDFDVIGCLLGDI